MTVISRPIAVSHFPWIKATYRSHFAGRKKPCVQIDEFKTMPIFDSEEEYQKGFKALPVQPLPFRQAAQVDECGVDVDQADRTLAELVFRYTFRG